MEANYTKLNYVNWEADTTGRYLFDEICHMSCYSKTSNFDTYIMPQRNITYTSSKKIHLCTVSVGMYRSLRKTLDGTIIKTNTEVVALKKFIQWLSENSTGGTPIVFVYYEPFEYSPFILLLALKRYGLLDEFKNVVHGFANAYPFIKKKCKRSVSSMSIKVLAKILLDCNNIKTFDCFNRARMINQILVHLSVDSTQELHISREMEPYVSTVADVDDRLGSKIAKRNIQFTLKPIFMPYLKEYRNRRRAIILRNILTNKYSLDYGSLKELWSKGYDKFKNEMYDMITAPPKDVDDLIGIISLHFQNGKKYDLVATANNEVKTGSIDEVKKDMDALSLE